MLDPNLVAFATVAAILTVTPGADMALVARQVLRGGRAAALLTTLGIAGGCVTHAAASALGLSVILHRSATAFEAVKLAGAAYLILLGLLACRDALTDRRGRTAPATAAETGPASHPADSFARSVTHGCLTNLLNPKVALFYLAVLPQFVPSGGSLLAWSLGLAAVHIAMGVVWLSIYALLLERLAGAFRSTRVIRVLHTLTALALLGLGTRLALERR